MTKKCKIFKIKALALLVSEFSRWKIHRLWRRRR